MAHRDLRYIIDHWCRYENLTKSNKNDIEAIKKWLDTVEIPEPGDPPFFIKGVVDNYSDLLLSYPTPSQFDFVYVENSQGTGWLPGSLGGTYYGSGLYMWNGSTWIHDKDEIHKALDDINTALAERLIWGGSYILNQTYDPTTMVEDDGWLMVSNTTTSDRPAPQPYGSEFYVYQGTGGIEDVATSKQLLFGSRYTFSRSGYITGYRIYTKVGNRYELYIVEDPLGTPIVRQGLTLVANQDGWNVLNVAEILIKEGREFDLIIKVSEPDPVPTISSLNYNYQTSNSNPTTGQITHPNNSRETLRINYVDSDANNNTSYLQSLTIGDIVTSEDVSWAIQSIQDQGSFIEFTISPPIQSAFTGIRSFDFETVTATPITYSIDTDYWLTNANVIGLFSSDGVYENVVTSENAYGADLRVQEAQTSDDWDLASAPYGGSGGSFEGLSGIANILPDTEILKLEGSASTNQQYASNPQAVISETIELSFEEMNIYVEAFCSVSSNNRNCIFGLFIDGVQYGETVIPRIHSSEFLPFSWCLDGVNLPLGTHNVELRYGRGGQNTVATITNPKIVFKRS